MYVSVYNNELYAHYQTIYICIYIPLLSLISAPWTMQPHSSDFSLSSPSLLPPKISLLILIFQSSTMHHIGCFSIVYFYFLFLFYYHHYFFFLMLHSIISCAECLAFSVSFSFSFLLFIAAL